MQQFTTRQSGLTIIELLIVIFIMGVTVTGLFGLFILSLRMAAESERQVIGMALANERMEMIRNLPYTDVGTLGGVPAGSIPQSEQIIRNQMTFTVATDIKYIDDPYDGLAEPGSGKVTICHKPGTAAEKTMEVPPSSVNAHLAHGDTTGACGGGGVPAGDAYNADYKQARVEVSWNWQLGQRSTLLISIIAPPGYEGGEEGGTLDFYAMDASGSSVQSATVTLVNNDVSPVINLTTQTNEEGRLVIPGLPISSQNYKLAVTKPGYTTESTYDITSSFIPDTDHLHLSTIQGEVTPKIFSIDQIASLNVITEDEGGAALPNIPYHLQGTKTIGVDGSGDAVYKLSVAAQTGATGGNVHDNLEWDNYGLTVDGATTGYDIKESSLPLPLVINPGDNTDLTVTLVEHTPISLHVTVLNSSQGMVDNATVHLLGNGVDLTQGTGVAGQVMFTDLPVDGTYTISIDAPGYAPITQDVSVLGTSSATFILATP